MKRSRFLVISYDKDEQQTFYDLISVEGEADPWQDALDIVGRLRPYAVPCDTCTVDDLSDLREALDKATDEDCLPFYEQTKALTREQCVELLEEISIQVYDTEDLATLREAVRSNLEDGTLIAEDHELYIQ
jgi:hypothetical protein